MKVGSLGQSDVAIYKYLMRSVKVIGFRKRWSIANRVHGSIHNNGELANDFLNFFSDWERYLA